jgi:hypothetical protein
LLRERNVFWGKLFRLAPGEERVLGKLFRLAPGEERVLGEMAVMD